MKAAWVGQMAGVGWGLPTEFNYIDEMIPVEGVPEWKPEMINQQGNDDLYVEMTFLSSMERHGTDVSIRQAGIDFANTGYGLWAANRSGRENLRSGIAPPESGHPYYNSNCEDIDYQIEADYSGIIAPGMPNVAIGLGEKFGRLMNYGDGVYGGQFVGGMYAAAFFSDDIHEIIREGLRCIPEQSNYAACVRDVIDWHEEYPDQWEKCWVNIMDKYFRTLDHQPFHQENREAWVGIDAKVNGAFIVLGLLYGKGDMDSTIIYSMRCGLDSDCNPSNAAGVLATTIGYEKLPEKFKTGLDPGRRFSYTDYDFNDLQRVSETFMRRFVVDNGGEIETDEQGREQIFIKSTSPVPSPFQPAYDPGTHDPGNRFSEDELAQIKAYSYKDFAPVLEDAAPGWRVFYAGKASELELQEYEGRKEVLVIAPMSAERSAVVEFAGGDPVVSDEGLGQAGAVSARGVLRFFVNAGSGKPWELSLRINAPGERIRVDEIISREETGGWKEFQVPFPLADGKIPRIIIEVGPAGDGVPNSAYVSSLAILMQDQ
jgi:hypothetical protein